MMKLATVVILLLFLILAACTGILYTNSAGQQGKSPAPDVVSSPTSSTTPSTQQSELGQGVVIMLTRSGGINGKTEQWIIYADGRITKDSVEVGHASQDKLTSLLQNIDQLGFYNLQGSYMPLNTCCDRFTYELAVTNGGKTNKVTFLEGTPDLPAGLWQTTDLIIQLITAGTK